MNLHRNLCQEVIFCRDSIFFHNTQHSCYFGQPLHGAAKLAQELTWPEDCLRGLDPARPSHHTLTRPSLGRPRRRPPPPWQSHAPPRLASPSPAPPRLASLRSRGAVTVVCLTHGLLNTHILELHYNSFISQLCTISDN